MDFWFATNNLRKGPAHVCKYREKLTFSNVFGFCQIERTGRIANTSAKRLKKKPKTGCAYFRFFASSSLRCSIFLR